MWWHTVTHGRESEGWNWRMEWVDSTLHTTSANGVSSITFADAHTSAASSRLNWRPCRFKWTRPFRQKTKSGFCACAITFQMQSTTADAHNSAASSRLNWRPRRFKWIRPFRRKTKSGFCACAITFQTQSTCHLRKAWHETTRFLFQEGNLWNWAHKWTSDPWLSTSLRMWRMPFHLYELKYDATCGQQRCLTFWDCTKGG